MIFATFEYFDVRCGILDVLHVFIILQLIIILSLFIMLQISRLSLNLLQISLPASPSPVAHPAYPSTLRSMRYHRQSSRHALILDLSVASSLLVSLPPGVFVDPPSCGPD